MYVRLFMLIIIRITYSLLIVRSLKP